MGQATLTWLSPILVALVSGGVAYLVALRKTSGRIATTEASKLWDEASSLRGVYQAEIERLRQEIEKEREQRQTLEQQARERTIELALVQRKVDALERENARLAARVAELENGLAASH